MLRNLLSEWYQSSFLPGGHFLQLVQDPSQSSTPLSLALNVLYPLNVLYYVAAAVRLLPAISLGIRMRLRRDAPAPVVRVPRLRGHISGLNDVGEEEGCVLL